MAEPLAREVALWPSGTKPCFERKFARHSLGVTPACDANHSWHWLCICPPRCLHPPQCLGCSLHVGLKRAAPASGSPACSSGLGMLCLLPGPRLRHMSPEPPLDSWCPEDLEAPPLSPSQPPRRLSCGLPAGPLRCSHYWRFSGLCSLSLRPRECQHLPRHLLCGLLVPKGNWVPLEAPGFRGTPQGDPGGEALDWRLAPLHIHSLAQLSRFLI